MRTRHYRCGTSRQSFSNDGVNKLSITSSAAFAVTRDATLFPTQIDAMKLFIVSLLIGAAAAFAPVAAPKAAPLTVREMHVVSSIGSWKKRSKTCQVIRRRGRYYVIDKKNPRNKARQGGAKMKPWKKGK